MTMTLLLLTVVESACCCCCCCWLIDEGPDTDEEGDVVVGE